MPSFPFMPRDAKFFDLFEADAKNMVKVAQRLKDLVVNWDSIEARISEITELEHEGDSITHDIIKELHHSFITPFDREDIISLAHSIDDVIDFIQAAADDMLIFKVERPGSRAKELADIVVRSAEEVQKVMPKLRRKAELRQMLECCVEINRLENMADTVYRAAISELFDNPADVIKVIKWREIYEHMESATDRCEDVSNVLEGVSIKYE